MVVKTIGDSFISTVFNMLLCFYFLIRHEFHKKCVDTWLKDKLTCPLCKYDLIIENDVSTAFHFCFDEFGSICGLL